MYTIILKSVLFCNLFLIVNTHKRAIHILNDNL